MFVDCFYPRVNGVVVSVKSYSDELSKKGHKVLIICPDYSDDKEMKTLTGCYYEGKVRYHDNVSIFRVSSADIIWSKEDKLAKLNKWRTIKSQLDRFHPDVVHINSEFALGITGLTYARHRKVPIVFTFHTLWEEYFAEYAKLAPSFIAKKAGKDFTKFYLKRVDEIIVPTQRIGDVVKRYEIRNSYDILPTGIPSEVYEYDNDNIPEFKEKIYKEFPSVKNKKVLLYVGRIVKEKNLYFLIDMLGEVQKSDKNTVLLFVGGGPEEEALKKYAKTKSYGNDVCFTGYQPRNQLSYFYRLASLFVFPSCTETQGLVTVEAMMCGLPVVAIGEMGTLDIMQGDNGGFMVKNDIQEFTSKVCLLLNDKSLYEKKKNDAFRWSQQWRIDRLTETLISYYKKAIKHSQEHFQLNMENAEN